MLSYTCPHCHEAVLEQNAVCQSCSIEIEKHTPSTKSLENPDYEEGTPKWGTARFSTRMNLIFQVREHAQRYVFDADVIREITLGRHDPESDWSPDVDLRAVGGHQRGVSRRHATVIKREGALHLLDCGSPNGTYLNGQKLVPNQPRILRDGDDVRLGHLVLRVLFQPMQDG